MPRTASFRSLIHWMGTFQGMMALLVAGILLITALVFILFTREEVVRATLTDADESARNVLQVVNLNILSEYRNLESFRHYALEKYRAQLNNLVDLVVAHIEGYRELEERGFLTGEQARSMAGASVERLRYGHNDYFYMYDARNVAVSHPDPNVKGRDMSALTDQEGRPLLKAMREQVQADGKGSCTLLWLRLGETNPVPKLLYFYHYTNWNWLVGTGIYIDDVDADAQRMMDEIMGVLKEAFAHVKISETGYFFVFDGAKNILIHPELSGTNAATLLDDLIRASANPALPLKYLWTKPGEPPDRKYWKYSHVRHFKPLDWYIASSVYEDEMEKPALRILRRQAIFAMGVIGIVLAGALWLVSRVTRPLSRLTRFADRLQETDFAPLQAETEQLLTIRFPDEVGRLSKTMGNMERRLQQYLSTVQEAAAARERLQSELRIAYRIQMSMLPGPWPAERKELDLAFALEPAKVVGGDLYDYFFIDERRLCLAIGDVSDKGIPAALFMARSIALLRYIMMKDRLRPHEALARLNGELFRGNEFCMFLTALIGVLDLDTGHFEYSNAGHLAPFCLSASEGCTSVEIPSGKPLGVMEEARYRSMEIAVRPGQTLLFYTDGVTEAMDTSGQLFGEERLKKLLANAVRFENTRKVADTILSEVRHFAGEAVQSDDITLLCVRRPGAGKEEVHGMA